MTKYRQRINDKVLDRKLKSIGAVLIEGPKWCGKTTTAEQFAKTTIYVADPELQKQYMTMADLSPKKLLEGKTPLLIDEWQLIPKIWDTIRWEVDHRGEVGQFILTGSSVPASFDNTSHTGTGRFAWLLMRPMSLFESGESNGEVSISDMFEGKKEIFARTDIKLTDIAHAACRGGWPKTTTLSKDVSLSLAFDYLDAIVRYDISSVDGVSRDKETAKRLMRVLARHQGTQATIETICQDMETNDGAKITTITVNSYINALKKIFVIEDMRAWNPNLRSKTAIRTSDTRYFIDPSIATAALGISPDDLINDLNTFGFIFETLAARDLRVYADALDASVYHYKDKNGLECDAVIHLRNGKYGLVEIKLGGDKLIEQGAATLLKLSSKIDTDKMYAPSFMMVLTASGDMAYRRKDGVYVVPISCLKY